MRSEEDKCDYGFSIIEDSVSETDYFEGETHQQTSNLLYRLLNSSDRSVTIGLEGSWGAGKSTVINLLRKELGSSSDPRSLFFIFDAWAHDGDPLRTIFLESLISSIDSNREDSYLQELAERITSRSKTVKVVSRKKASRLGKWLSVSAFLIPTGAAILSAVNYADLSLTGVGNTFHWQFIVGFLLAVAPLLVLGGWWLFGKLFRREMNWAFLESESSEEYSQDIVEDGERTSIEFEKYFKEILRHSWQKKKFARAIFVIDNLDRVDPDHAKAIWSTLQTFFQGRSNSTFPREAWENSTWFIVPYDRKALGRIWKDFGSTDNSQSDAASSAPESFLGKCFQLVVEVPQPVLSGWAKYVSDIANRALFGWSSKNIEIAVDTFRKSHSQLSHSPTPRQMQKFVNQVGILGMRWRSKMSPRAMALYAIYSQSNDRDDFRQKMIKDEIPYRNIASTFGSAEANEIKKEIAGMFFGVEKERGIELLLTPMIQECLSNGDGVKLKQTYELHGEAFWIVWDSQAGALLPEPGQVSVDYVLAATNAISHAMVGLRGRISSGLLRIKQVWQPMLLEWDSARYDYASAADSLMCLFEDNQWVIDGLKPLAENEILSIISAEDRIYSSKESLANILNVNEFLRKNKVEVSRYYHPRYKNKNWISWTNMLRDNGLSIRNIILNGNDITAISNDIGFAQNSVDQSVLESIIYTINNRIYDKDWAPVIDPLISYVSTVGRSVGINLIYLLMLSLRKVVKPKEWKRVSDCVKSQGFWIANANEPIDSVRDLPILSAVCHQNKIFDHQYVSIACKSVWMDQSDEKCIEFYDRIKQLGCLDLIWKMAKDSRGNLAINIIRKHQTVELFSMSDPICFIGEYDWASEDELKDLIQKLSASGSINNFFEEYDLDATFDKTSLILNRYGSDDSKQRVEDYLKSLNAEEWSEAIRELLPLAECRWSKNHVYSDALKMVLLSHLDGSHPLDDQFWLRFGEVTRGAMTFTKKVIKPFADKYFNSDEDVLSEEAFLAVRDCLSKVIKFVDENDIMGRLENWIEGEKWERIEWFLGLHLKYAYSPFETLVSRIKAKLKMGGGSSSGKVLIDLAAYYGVSIDDDNSDLTKEEASKKERADD